jgi:hypothetical protein
VEQTTESGRARARDGARALRSPRITRRRPLATPLASLPAFSAQRTNPKAHHTPAARGPVALGYNLSVMKWLIVAVFILAQQPTKAPERKGTAQPKVTQSAEQSDKSNQSSSQAQPPISVTVNNSLPSPNCESSKEKAEENMRVQRRFTFYTGLLVIAGFVTAAFIWWQAKKTAEATKAMQDSLPHQKSAADAALLNAQAVINAERSWIGIVPMKFGAGQWRFEATNHGKTPAELVSFCCRFEINLINGLTEPPLYKDRVETYKRFAFPNSPEPTRVGVMLINSLLDACAEKEQVMSGAKTFVIIGRVVYYDVLHKVDPPHETRYCYGWNVADDTLFSMGPSSYHGHT